MATVQNGFLSSVRNRRVPADPIQPTNELTPNSSSPGRATIAIGDVRTRMPDPGQRVPAGSESPKTAGGFNPGTAPAAGGSPSVAPAEAPAGTPASESAPSMPGAGRQLSDDVIGSSIPGQSGKYGGINPGGMYSQQAGGAEQGGLLKTAKDYLNQETDTVEGRMASMLSKSSDYMRRAESKGLQLANSRGLLNSSMAAGASQAAAMDAALPIAQQDASTYAGFGERNQQLDHQRGLNYDQWAQERAVKQWEQENLAYSQFLKGVSDINMQDMSASAKQQAVDNLWDMYMKGRPISSSLLDVEIKDGKIVRNAPAAGGGTAGGGETGGGMPGGGAPGGSSMSQGGQEKDYWDYGTVEEMPTWMREQYSSRYGNMPPKTAKSVISAVEYLNDKFSKYIVKPGAVKGAGTESQVTGVRFNNGAAMRQYESMLADVLKKEGVTIGGKIGKGGVTYGQIYRAMTGSTLPSSSPQWAN